MTLTYLHNYHGYMSSLFLVMQTFHCLIAIFSKLHLDLDDMNNLWLDNSAETERKMITEISALVT